MSAPKVVLVDDDAEVLEAWRLTLELEGFAVLARRSADAALAELGLAVPTTDLAHVIDGVLRIDHVAVPAPATASASRIVADVGGKRLSDHDAYVVDVVGLTP